MDNSRSYTPLDQLIMKLDAIIAAGQPSETAAERPFPGNSVEPEVLTDAQRRLSAALMRVNHAGEVAAQALYQGQAISAKEPRIRDILLQSAQEEVDHLQWCRQRLDELDSRTSYLDPLWYGGSFSIGMMAGMLGDDWNLGFVAETERQVVRHLDTHLERLSQSDTRSRLILKQMREDEGKHASVAIEQGAKELPRSLKRIMTLCSRVMTGTAYWL